MKGHIYLSKESTEIETCASMEMFLQKGQTRRGDALIYFSPLYNVQILLIIEGILYAFYSGIRIIRLYARSVHYRIHDYSVWSIRLYARNVRYRIHDYSVWSIRLYARNVRYRTHDYSVWCNDIWRYK